MPNRRKSSKHDPSILEAALVGFQHQVDGILAAMGAIRKQLAEGPSRSTRIKRKARKMSAAAIANIRAAQKKRWAAWKKQHGK